MSNIQEEKNQVAQEVRDCITSYLLSVRTRLCIWSALRICAHLLLSDTARTLRADRRFYLSVFLFHMLVSAEVRQGL